MDRMPIFQVENGTFDIYNTYEPKKNEQHAPSKETKRRFIQQIKGEHFYQ